MTERVTPHNLDAEKALLGALLINGHRYLDVADRLEPQAFFRAEHQRIYIAVGDLVKTDTEVNPITVRDRMDARGHLEEGTEHYLFVLTNGYPHGSVSHVQAFAEIVREKWALRRLMAAARQILDESEEASLEADEIVNRAERAIFAVAEQGAKGDFIDTSALLAEGIPAIEKLLETKQGATGVRTGFIDFDDMTRGLQPGALTLIAARPSMGKSAFALNVAYQAARTGCPVGFFSLEMSKQELFMRLVASVGRIDGHRLQSGYCSQTDYERMGNAFSEIGNTSLFIDDSPNVGMLEMRGKARRLKARSGLGLVVMDYLQLMQVAKAENRNLAIAEISRSLKLLARELEVPVVALSQLSRETERRSGQKPMLSDLRDSGALEQDADMVVFIHRPEVYQQTDDNAGLAEIIIAKQRGGPTGTVKLRWNKESTRFDNWSAN